jgi:hypothetical protein
MKAGRVVASGACGSGTLSGPATGEARALLRAQEPDVTIGLALAALMAGLAPVDFPSPLAGEGGARAEGVGG